MKKQKLLIVTASDTKLPENQEYVYLGSWCLKYPIESKSGEHVILDYHWNDRKKLQSDFLYLQGLNDKLIGLIGNKLNQIHNVNHTRKYWELVLGYWVNLYSSVLFDRWSMVLSANKRKCVDKVCVLSYDETDLVAHNLSDFIENVFSDDWNLKLYSILFKECSEIKCETVNLRREKILRERLKPHIPRIKNLIADLLNFLSGLVGRNDRFFLISSYIHWFAELKLVSRLVASPRYWKIPRVPTSDNKILTRTWELTKEKGSDDFTKLAIKYLPKFLPKIFVEDYSCLALEASKINWPKKPKVIMTSVLHFSNELFSHWAGSKREMGARLIIGEHGGFGVQKFNGAHSFQMKCADVFFSTGWGREVENVKPIGNFRKLKKIQKFNSKGKALLVTVAMPRYSFDIRSMAISSQMESYFKDQFLFFNKLPKHIKNDLLVRLYQDDYKWSQSARWRDNCPKVKFDNSSINIWKKISGLRLLISTYNATNYLDSLSMNFPTIIYWNPNFWQVSKRAEPYFNSLKKAKIFHESPISAAKHVSLIWNDIESWWSSNKVQHAREMFCEKFVNNVPDIVERLEREIREEESLANKI